MPAVIADRRCVRCESTPALLPSVPSFESPAAGDDGPAADGLAARFGAVTYLNSKPLIEDLAELIAPAPLTLDYPSHLAADLAAGQLEVALVPSFSALQSLVAGRGRLLSDACVAARGPVRSVKLLCRRRPGEIRTLALDEGSRTSAALAQLVLRERFGVTPQLQPFGLKSHTADCDADAIVMIGDRAMFPPADASGFVETHDLGALWKTWTGLPFVFAVWATRLEAVPAEWVSALETARNRGVARIDAIAEREADATGVTASDGAGYLRHNLHFTLGPAERAGLELFAELAAAAGLLPHAPPLQSAEIATAAGV